jgi:hypothetical protein
MVYLWPGSHCTQWEAELVTMASQNKYASSGSVTVNMTSSDCVYLRRWRLPARAALKDRRTVRDYVKSITFLCTNNSPRHCKTSPMVLPIEIHETVFKRAPLQCYLNITIFRDVTPCRSILILSTYLRLGLPGILFSSGFCHRYHVCIHLLPHSFYFDV